MTNPQLTDYIKKAKESGQDDMKIKTDLLATGWSEDVVNESLGIMMVPKPPVASVPLSAPQNATINFFDRKTVDTMKWAALWWAVGSVIITIGSTIADYFFIASTPFGQFREFGGFLVGDFVGAILLGLFWGLIAGVALAKFYPKIMAFQKRFLANKLNTLFKLLFITPIVFVLLQAGLIGFLGFGWFMVYVVSVALAYYLYAKMMVKYVGHYYPDFI